MGTRRPEVKRRLHKFGIGGARLRNLLNSRMPESLPAEITGIYRYPVKGLSPERLSRVVLAAGQTLARRPPLRHRKRPERLRSRRAQMDVESLFSDADAGRMAGGAAHAIRRCEPYPDHPRQRPGSRSRRSGNRPGPRRHRAVFCSQFRREAEGAAENSFRRRPQLFRRSEKGGFDHQSRQPPGHRRRRRPAGASAALPRQPLCQGMAGLARVRPARPDHRDRRGQAEGS